MITEIVTAAVAAAASGGITYGICRKILKRDVQKDDGFEDKFKELEQIAYFDNVTGLSNMTKFSSDCKIMMELNTDAHFGILVLEVDNLNKIRTLYGLEECDRVRKFVADKLTEYLGDDYCYGRVHEDLFAICAMYENVSLLSEIAENLTANMRVY